MEVPPGRNRLYNSFSEETDFFLLEMLCNYAIKISFIVFCGKDMFTLAPRFTTGD